MTNICIFHFIGENTVMGYVISISQNHNHVKKHYYKREAFLSQQNEIY